MVINQQSVNSILVVIIPILGTLLPGLLKRDSLPAWANGIIAGVIVLLASVGTAYAKDQLGPDFLRDTIITASAISALLAGPLKPLDAFLQSNVFASKPAPTAMVPTVRRSSVITKATGTQQVKPGEWIPKDDSLSG